MSKGEVPIAYIIALILGVAVIAVLGYWFFVVQGTGGAQMSITECNNKAFMYCTLWSANGYYVTTDGSAMPSMNLINGGPMWFAKPGATSYAPGCSAFTVIKLVTGTTAEMKAACINDVLGGQ